MLEEAVDDIILWEDFRKYFDVTYSAVMTFVYGETPVRSITVDATPVRPDSFAEGVTPEVGAFFAAVCSPPPLFDNPAHEPFPVYA